MAQWFERSPPTNVARARFLPMPYVGCVCCYNGCRGGNICLTLQLSSSRFNWMLYERSKARSVIGAARCNSRPAGKDVSPCLTIIPRASAGYQLGITILYPTSASGIHDG